MRTIWKYPIPMADSFEIEMPGDREFLTLDVQDGFPHIWVSVDPESGTFIRKFHLVGTGNPIPEETQVHHELVFRGSFQMSNGAFVFHLFEEIVRARS
jgi:hypothetical protein